MRGNQEISEIINNRLLDLCRKKNITRYQLCMKTGVAQSSVCTALKGKTVLATDTILLLCKGLEITPGEFFAGMEESYQSLNEGDKALLQCWEELTDKQKASVRAFMEGLLMK